MTIHVVQRGDTLTSIARRYGVSVSRLITDNGITDPGRLVVGQALIVLIPAQTYTVQSGDTLSSIAASTGVSQIELVQNNPDLIVSPILQPGQVITLRFTEDKVRELTINGYAYPHIRLNVLQRALPYMTYLTIFGYGFTDDGELIGIDDQPLINLAYSFKTAPVMLISSITEEGGFDSDHASRLFNDTELQDKVLDNIIATMRQKGYVGLDVDFEYIRAEDSGAYLRFLENAASHLRQNGFFMNTDLAPKTRADQPGLLYEAHDYAAIGAISDTVLLMTYEWGYTYGPPMAVAPIDQVRRVVRYAVTEIPRDKILMGIPNYGYDWPLPYERGVTRATTLSNQYAVELAGRQRSEILFDERAQTPYFEYYVNGVEHEVWFEDVRSISSKLELADEYGLRGVGYWSLMYPFAQNWALISARYNVRKVVS